MEETIFEAMERTGFVDRLLPALALFVPILVFTALKMFRTTEIVARRRPEFILIAVGMPILWILWRIYNAVADHYGTASVLGIFVNAIIILCASIAVWSFYYVVLLRPPANGTEPANLPPPETTSSQAENLTGNDA
jgi:hypothetical protein